MLIKSFLAYLPREGRKEETAEALRLVRWIGAGNLRGIRAGYVLAFRGFGVGSGGPGPGRVGAGEDAPGTEMPRGVAAGPSRATQLLHVLPGCATEPMARELESAPDTPEGYEAWAERRVDLFNFIRAEAFDFLLFSDVLSLLPYWVGELHEGIAVSSSIEDLFCVFPELVRPMDPLGTIESLTGGRGTRTVHARVRAAAPGMIIRWREGEGVSVRRDRRLEPVPQEADLRVKDAVQMCVEPLASKINAFLEGEEEVVLPLTGGFDSRLMACLLRDLGIPCQTVTLGRRFHTEVKVAKRIAKILDLPHALLTPRGELLDRIPLWLEVQQGQSKIGTLYIAELLDRGFTFGTPLLHGLIGGNLVWSAYFSNQVVDESLEGIARFLVRRAQKDLKPDFGEALGLPIEFETRVEEMMARLAPSDAPMQTFLIWDLENRQPRGTAAQVPYLGQEYRAGAPFYDRRQIAAWMRIPRMGLETRGLLRELFRERYPQVASMPHAEEHPDRLPNNLTSLRHLLGYYALRGRDGILRRVLPGHDKRIGRRYVWGMWHDGTHGQTGRQLRALDEKRGVVGDVLGWTPAAVGGTGFWNEISTTSRRAEEVRTAFYLLSEYCDWVKRTVSAVRSYP